MRWGQHAASALARSLSSQADRRRLEALAVRDAGYGYDAFGMHRDWLAAAQALVGPLYRHYFRVSSHGAEHIPASGPAILVANHAGMLPIDAAMICMDVFAHTTPPRIVRCIGDRFLPELPFVGTLASRCGMVSGTPANVRRLLEDGELCLIFPEGMPAIGKPFRERYQLHGWRAGHAELAMRHGAPVAPIGVIGSEEQWPQIGRISRVHPFGAPYLPIPASPLPLPVHYHLHYGEPIELRGHVDPRPCRATERQGMHRAEPFPTRAAFLRKSCAAAPSDEGFARAGGNGTRELAGTTAAHRRGWETHMTTAKDVMTENPTTVRELATVREAVALFQELDVRHLPVVNARGELVGMLSDRDLRGLAFPEVIDNEWIGTIQTALDARVSSLMSSSTIAVTVEAEASEVIELMLEHKVGAVPVTDADGVLVGIISYVDLLRVLGELEAAAEAAQ